MRRTMVLDKAGLRFVKTPSEPVVSVAIKTVTGAYEEIDCYHNEQLRGDDWDVYEGSCHAWIDDFAESASSVMCDRCEDQCKPAGTCECGAEYCESCWNKGHCINCGLPLQSA